MRPGATNALAPTAVAVANAKNVLQELCQGRGWPLPTYEVEQSGSAPTFRVVARINGSGRSWASAPVSAANRRDGEKLAAVAMLEILEAEPLGRLVPSRPL